MSSVGGLVMLPADVVLDAGLGVEGDDVVNALAADDKAVL